MLSLVESEKTFLGWSFSWPEFFLAGVFLGWSSVMDNDNVTSAELVCCLLIFAHDDGDLDDDG